MRRRKSEGYQREKEKSSSSYVAAPAAAAYNASFFCGVRLVRVLFWFNFSRVGQYSRVQSDALGLLHYLSLHFEF